MTVESLTQNDYKDILKIADICLSSLKTGRMEIRDIISALSEIFLSSNVEFFPPNGTLDGVDLDQACDTNPFKSEALTEYADRYWRFDPFFEAKFCLNPTNLVFRTDDFVLDYQATNLEHYQTHPALVNSSHELVIRLCDQDGFYGTFCILRSLTSPDFEERDIDKAKLVLPFLMNLFQGVYQCSRNKDELKILEYFAESLQEGFFIIDSRFNLVFSNDKARRLCQKFSEAYTGMEYRQYDMVADMPSQILEDCRYLFNNFKTNRGSSTMNRITTSRYGEKYYLRYVLIKESTGESFLGCFITSFSELSKPDQASDEIISNGCELSSREQTIIRHVATGLTNKELGKLLSISPFTVQNHLRNIFQKTGIVNRTQLVNLIK
jgi:DNA-binding CsgD family transcriptional regulator